MTLSCGTWVREAARRLVEIRFPGVCAAAEGAVRSAAGEGMPPAVGVDSPRLSAELLLCHVLGLGRVELAAHPERPVPPEALSRLEGLLRRRMDGEPVAYLVGVREFFGRDFRVTPATLIPRPETEHLVEAALAAFPAPGEHVRFADLGTGSGCIAVTLCAERPDWRGLALDRSAAALGVASRNAGRHGARERLLFVRGDFLCPPLAADSLDLVISNPPYVSLAEYAALSPEVRDFEPVSALVPGFADDGGRHGHAGLPPAGSAEDAGLVHLQAVAKAARSALRPGGLLLMEHGYAQGEAIRLLLKRHAWENIYYLKDLYGIERLVGARRPAD